MSGDGEGEWRGVDSSLSWKHSADTATLGKSSDTIQLILFCGHVRSPS